MNDCDMSGISVDGLAAYFQASDPDIRELAFAYLRQRALEMGYYIQEELLQSDGQVKLVTVGPKSTKRPDLVSYITEERRRNPLRVFLLRDTTGAEVTYFGESYQPVARRPANNEQVAARKRADEARKQAKAKAEADLLARSRPLYSRRRLGRLDGGTNE